MQSNCSEGVHEPALVVLLWGEVIAEDTQSQPMRANSGAWMQ